MSLICLGAFILVLAGLWTVIPILHGLPWVPAHRKRIRSALELADVQPGETVYDLGAGDGRVLIVAARDFGARAVGVEIEPVHCAVAWLWAVFSGVVSLVSIRCGNFFKTDLQDADVVFMYVRPKQAARLQKHLERQLRTGARVVSIAVDLEGWQPAAVDTDDLNFLYRMPPTPGNLADFLARRESLRSQGDLVEPTQRIAIRIG